MACLFEDTTNSCQKSENLDFTGDFDVRLWNPDHKQYGIWHMLRHRDTSPGAVQTAGVTCAPVADCQLSRSTKGETKHRKQSGHGNDISERPGTAAPAGTSVPVPKAACQTSPTEVKDLTAVDSERGQWWRNRGKQSCEVVVRESQLLESMEILRVGSGHYVQQAGPTVSVNGIERMPISPCGWVTLDATAVGGPRYLDRVRSPLWRVVFGAPGKGGVVVREGVSLTSDKLAVLVAGAIVEQRGPQVFESGVMRMPVVLQQASPATEGWVTIDATCQGGPRFLEPCVLEAEQHSKPLLSEAPLASPANVWDKDRKWRVINVEDDQTLPVVLRAEPFTPTSKPPSEDKMVRHLRCGDLVAQVGHSRKVRGRLVMPIQTLFTNGTPVLWPEERPHTEGWVTRRIVDKAEHDVSEWFEEVFLDKGTWVARRRREREQQG